MRQLLVTLRYRKWCNCNPFVKWFQGNYTYSPTTIRKCNTLFYIQCLLLLLCEFCIFQMCPDRWNKLYWRTKFRKTSVHINFLFIFNTYVVLLSYIQWPDHTLNNEDKNTPRLQIHILPTPTPRPALSPPPPILLSPLPTLVLLSPSL